MARVAVVTGGTRGIGEAISVGLKSKGYRVAATYVGNDTAAQSFQAQTGIPIYKFDVGDYAACEKAVGQITRDLGPIEILVNNAGITRDAAIHRMTAAQWSEVIRTNLDSAFNMTRLVIDGMRARGFGRIISISSINGRKGNAGQANYTAAKAGLVGMSKSLAQEVASRNVTVNCVAPGFVKSAMTDALGEKIREGILEKVPMKKLGTPEDVAAAVVYLASDEAGWVTGQTFHINGGMAMI